MTLAKVDPYQDKINHPPTHVNFCPVHHSQSDYDSHKSEFKPAKQPRLSDTNQEQIDRHDRQSVDLTNTATTSDDLQCTCTQPNDGAESAASSSSRRADGSIAPSVQFTNSKSIQHSKQSTADQVKLSSKPSQPAKTVIPTLDRRFLIYMTILRDTDGRDKLTKSVQNACKLLVWYMKRVNSQLHILGQVSQQQGNSAVGIADTSFTSAARTVIALMLLTGNVQIKSTAIAVKGSGTHQQHVSTVTVLSTALSALFSTSSAARYATPAHAELKTQVKKVDGVISGLSSARKVMRLFKWCYTLPAMNKSYYMLRQDIINYLDGRNQRQQTAALDETTVSKAHSVAVDIDQQQQPSKSRVSTLQQHMSLSMLTRLPVFSSLEFISHSLAVATDLCEDIQWYASVDLLPKHYAENAAQYGPSLWGSTIVLDLILTYRQIRGLDHALTEAQQQLSRCLHRLHNNSTSQQKSELNDDIENAKKTITQLRLGLYNQWVTMLKLSGDAGCCIPINLGQTHRLPEWWLPVFSLVSACTALHKLWIATKA